MRKLELARRYREVVEAVGRACERANRDPTDVSIVAVSKRMPTADILALYEVGHRAFGENYVQELSAKSVELGEVAKQIEWHLIGNLQRNKARDAVRFATVIETVDSIKLAEALAERAAAASQPLRVAVQVKLSSEPKKHGCSFEEAPDVVAAVRGLSALRLDGLMGVPPAVASPELARPYFRSLRELGERLNVTGLSMGMSSDFEIAIEEGSCSVRVGTRIFGARLPPQGPETGSSSAVDSN